MSNIVSAAIDAGSKIYGTTPDTAWFVTFITNDTKRGQLTALESGFFSLCDKGALFIFHTDQVVHVSPQIPMDQVLAAAHVKRTSSSE